MLTKEKLTEHVKNTVRGKSRATEHLYQMREAKALARDLGNGDEAKGTEQLVKLMEAWQSPDFSIKTFQEWVLTKEAEGKFREAGGTGGMASSAFGPFFRLGVDTIVQGGYQTPGLIWDQCFRKSTMKALAQPIAFLYNPDMPSQVDNGAEFNESNVVQQSAIVQAADYGLMWSVDQKGIDDDQTAELTDTGRRLGRNHAIHREIYMMGFVSGAAYTAFGVTVPAPSYTDPDGNTGVYSTARGNRPTSFTSLGPQGIINGILALKTMQDPSGKLILVQPDTLLIDPTNEAVAITLLNSDNYPATVTPSSTGFPGSSGAAFATNPLKTFGLKIRMSPHLKAKAVYIGESMSRSLVFYERLPLETMVESPTSGTSFDKRQYRVRTFQRYQPIWVEARYWYQMDDGSV